MVLEQRDRASLAAAKYYWSCDPRSGLRVAHARKNCSALIRIALLELIVLLFIPADAVALCGDGAGNRVCRVSLVQLSSSIVVKWPIHATN